MNVTKETAICVSLAAQPGESGRRFHNEGYEALGLNFVYIPLKVTGNLEAMLDVVKDNFKGCSISMPHKRAAFDYLNAHNHHIDRYAVRTESVNTIYNDGTSLMGHNTDTNGAREALKTVELKDDDKVILIGAGGVARAIAYSLKDKADLYIVNRTNETAMNLAKKLKVKWLPYVALQHEEGKLLINATSVGMKDPNECPIPLNSIDKYDVVMDVVISSSPTLLMQEARRLNKKAIPGKVMHVYQAAEQFKIYTGKKLPDNFVWKKLEEARA
ncbi:shikimate dehydrogenase [Candidatus Pacearchaeota archaeon]|nr:shikimate dehydrogenase [Candidatus Pacearchaeota archaeon]